MILTTGLFEVPGEESRAMVPIIAKTPNTANTMFRMPNTVTETGRCIGLSFRLVFAQPGWSWKNPTPSLQIQTLRFEGFRKWSPTGRLAPNERNEIIPSTAMRQPNWSVRRSVAYEANA